MGIMMAFTSVKPVVSHWAVAASTLISVMTEGSAGVTTVWLRTVTNVPNIKTASIMICLRLNPICAPLCLCFGAPAVKKALARPVPKNLCALFFIFVKLDYFTA